MNWPDSDDYRYVRTKDFEDVYHWWMISNGSVIDPTNHQYYLADKPCPSDADEYEVMNHCLTHLIKTKSRSINKLLSFIQGPLLL